MILLLCEKGVFKHIKPDTSLLFPSILYTFSLGENEILTGIKAIQTLTINEISLEREMTIERALVYGEADEEFRHYIKGETNITYGTDGISASGNGGDRRIRQHAVLRRNGHDF